jgi:hypothetical protein
MIDLNLCSSQQPSAIQPTSEESYVDISSCLLSTAAFTLCALFPALNTALFALFALLCLLLAGDSNAEPGNQIPLSDRLCDT